MAHINCWEFKKCGREADGDQVELLGVCPAAIEDRVDGANGGVNGGRVCWAIAGTLCKGEVQGSYALKLRNCIQCDFYKLVLEEEQWNFVSGGEVLKKIGSR
jgi:hypothetical protein